MHNVSDSVALLYMFAVSYRLKLRQEHSSLTMRMLTSPLHCQYCARGFNVKKDEY